MTTTTPKLNVKLLEKVKQAILDEPKRIDMRRWVTNPLHLAKSRRPACNTIGCIAGWTYNIAKKMGPGELISVDPRTIQKTAQDRLGLTDRQLVTLFYSENWYDNWFDKLVGLNPGTKAYAKVVAAYIDYFIAKETSNAKT